MKAYHFLKEDMRSCNGTEPAWTLGETRILKDKIIPCEYGYHASFTLFGALSYAPGPVACLVELSGEIIEHGNPIDKYAASSRQLIKAINIGKQLRLFAADCAEHVLHIFEEKFPNDLRPRKAIVAARDYANGKISAEELKTAHATVFAAGFAAHTVVHTVVHAAHAAAHVASTNADFAAVNNEKQWQKKQFDFYFGDLFI